MKHEITKQPGKNWELIYEPLPTPDELEAIKALKRFVTSVFNGREGNGTDLPIIA